MSDKPEASQVTAQQVVGLKILNPIALLKYKHEKVPFWRSCIYAFQALGSLMLQAALFALIWTCAVISFAFALRFVWQK